MREQDNSVCLFSKKHKTKLPLRYACGKATRLLNDLFPFSPFSQLIKWMILLFETAVLIISCSFSPLQQTGKETVKLTFWTLILRYAAVQGGERISDE